MKTAEEATSVKLPELNQAQMLEDYDYMVQTVRDMFPSATVNKKVYGIDVFEKLKSYRAGITENMTPHEFIELLYDALLACKGDHLWPFDLYYYKDHKYAKLFTSALNEGAIETNHVYWEYLQPRLERFKSAPVPLLYHDGDYYVRHDFTCNGMKYKSGMKLLTVDGKTPDEILPSIQDRLVLFDFKKRIFYGSLMMGHNFYVLMDDYGKKTQEFKFKNRKGELVELSVASAAMAVIHKPDKAILALGRTVEYFEDSQILYVRIPAMYEGDIPFYLAEIKKYAGREIRAAVIDIRGNGGGSDSVWRSVLELIIGKKYRWHTKMAIKNTRLARKHEASQLLLYRAIKDGIYFDAKSRYRREEIPFLDNEEFLVKETENRIKPTPDSLNLRVPIYVIAHNIYSSAANLSGFAKRASGITCVGTRNPMISGTGTDSFYISLPNSKIIFVLSGHIDLTGCKTAEDTLHTKMEVEVEMTAKERLDYLNRDISKIPLEEALTQYDPYFKKVLELLNAKNSKSVKN